MSIGQNLQFLRRMRSGMTQEDLAEKMGVSRQTISKWETGEAMPEMDKAMELCAFFSCTLDALFREDMGAGGDSYSGMQIQRVEAFSYVSHIVISREPEEDAIAGITKWALNHGIEKPDIIGWDFPNLSQEQINVFHMHGYAAACILPEGFGQPGEGEEVLRQPAQDYAVITIRDPFSAPFTLIPNAYKTLLAFLQVNGHHCLKGGQALPCFEKQYEREGVQYMDVYIAAED